MGNLSNETGISRAKLQEANELLKDCPQQAHIQKGEQFSVSLSWSEWSVVAKVDWSEP